MPSERFKTEIAESLKYVASRRHEVDNRSDVVAALRARKIGNTKTSIIFGSDNISYETDAMQRQKVRSGALPAAQPYRPPASPPVAIGNAAGCHAAPLRRRRPSSSSRGGGSAARKKKPALPRPTSRATTNLPSLARSRTS